MPFSRPSSIVHSLNLAQAGKRPLGTEIAALSLASFLPSKEDAKFAAGLGSECSYSSKSGKL